MRRIGLLLACLLMLAGCLPSDDTPAPADPTIGLPSQAGQPIPPTPTPADTLAEISFAAYESERAYFGPLIERFNQEHPGIRVTFVALDDITRLAENEPYDPDSITRRIVSAADTAKYYNPRPEDMARGYLLDLKPLMDADPAFDRDDFYPGVLDRFSRNDGVYMLPQFTFIDLLSYNRQLWARRGLPPPQPDWTIADMLAAAEQLAAQRGNEIAVYGTLAFDAQEVLFYELATAGIDLLATSPEQIRLDQPEIVAALERVIELARRGVIYAPPPPTGSIRTDDYQGMIFEQRAGMWHPETVYFGPRSGSPPFEVGTVPYPPRSWLPGYPGAPGYIISSGTRQPQAAWRWLAFLSKQPIPSEYNFRGPADARLLPARKSLAEQAGYWESLDAEAKAAVEAVLARREPPPGSYEHPVRIPLNQAIETVLRGEQPPAQALRQAQAELERQLAQAAATPSPAAGPIVVATPVAAVATVGATTIIFSIPSGLMMDQTRQLAQTFNQQHPDIFVEVRTNDAQTLDGLAASSDCGSWFGPPAPQEITATLDLQPLIDADSSFSLDDYPAVLLAPFRHAGRLHGLPASVNLRMLAYNQAAFDAAGLAHPAADWTLDTLISAAQQLTSGAGDDRRFGFAGISGNVSDLRFFFHYFGATIAQGNGADQRPNFTDPRVIQAAGTYLELLRAASPHQQLKGYTRGWVPDAQELAGQGKIAMWFDYGYDVSFLRGMTTPVLNIAIAPPPLSERPLSPYDLDMRGLFISARTQHAQACWTWLKAFSAGVAIEQGGFPARISVAESEAFRAGALPGAAEVYAAYRAAFDRTPATSIENDPRQSPIDYFWFYRAIDRAFQGKNLEVELDEAQALTGQYLDCVRAGTAASVCAKQIDPEYDGWKSAEQ